MQQNQKIYRRKVAIDEKPPSTAHTYTSLSGAYWLHAGLYFRGNAARVNPP